MSLVDIPPSSKRWVSLTPLIDVVFILIMFFMLTTQFDRKQILELSVLSEGRQASVTEDSNDIARVVVMSDGIWQFNGNRYSINDTSNMEALAEFETVYLSASSDEVVLQEIVTLIDKLAGAGIKQVSWNPAANRDAGEVQSR